MSEYNRMCRPIEWGLDRVDNTTDLEKVTNSTYYGTLTYESVRVLGTDADMKTVPDTSNTFLGMTVYPSLVVLDVDTVPTSHNLFIPEPSDVPIGTRLSFVRDGQPAAGCDRVLKTFSVASVFVVNGATFATYTIPHNVWHVELLNSGWKWYAIEV